MQRDLDASIEVLGLSVRSHNMLDHAGIKTVGQVVSMSHEDLLSIRNLGRRQALEIRDSLMEQGYLDHNAILPVSDSFVADDTFTSWGEAAGQLAASAMEEAIQTNGSSILPEHLLLAVVRQDALRTWMHKIGQHIDVDVVTKDLRGATSIDLPNEAERRLDEQTRSILEKVRPRRPDDEDPHLLYILVMKQLTLDSPSCGRLLMLGGTDLAVLAQALASIQ